ncbi:MULTISPECIES: type 1 glutamine amidotransferase [Rhizobium/Agrobacterium group]|uniref:type 1 glutamine amidotransferase n=1 Tax=Rhizobium/Agrobacterium group TaxID=227290 RepID=UPI002301E5C0|nr:MULTISPECIES: type 1 glutamine amidotransferase [Rhizobium/Agrobacterium group]MDA5631655.1 type 1 glutamine amidotransferase [Agrobacterium sp. ST15.16.024]MDF1887518.1 type 1 glutamine amidotransferase [Rhizobium rhizogenes]
MRVAIIENMAGTPHGQLGVALEEAGSDLHVIRAYAGEPLPTGAGEHDALIVLGGEQNALDDALYPYLPDLALLMKAFGDADKAVMGVCLGSQLLARAYGGENILSGPPEFGWEDVSLTEGGVSDPLLAGLDEIFPIFQWHRDTFTLPPGAIRLATNEATRNQAFRLGRAVYGTQFHFEASTAVVDRWCEAFPASVEKMAPGWLEKYSDHRGRRADMADAAGLEIARAWVRLI